MPPHSNEKRHIAVLGGGITGLTAAFRLREAGCAVTVYESSDRVGGVIRSIRDGSWLAEEGPNTLVPTTPEAEQLLADLGLEEKALPSRPEADKKYILREGELRVLPESPPAFLRSKLFSRKAKLALLREPLVPRLGGKDADGVGAPAPDAPEESLADFARRRLGPEILDYAVDPFVSGVYAGDPERLSVREAFPALHELELEHGSLLRGQWCEARARKKRGEPSRRNAPKLSFPEGLETLPRTLASILGDCVRVGTSVGRIHRNREGKWLLDEESQAYDAIILALPPFRLIELKMDIDSPLCEAAGESVAMPPVASVALGFRREQVAHALDGFGALVPGREKRGILGTIFSSTLFPGRAPAGHVLLSSYVGGRRSPELALRDREELFASVLAELRDLYGVTGDPVWRHAAVFPRAIPQYEIGFGRFRRLLDETERACPGLFFAGNCRDGISLGDSIASGAGAALKTREFLGDCADSPDGDRLTTSAG